MRIGVITEVVAGLWIILRDMFRGLGIEIRIKAIVGPGVYLGFINEKNQF